MLLAFTPDRAPVNTQLSGSRRTVPIVALQSFTNSPGFHLGQRITIGKGLITFFATGKRSRKMSALDLPPWTKDKSMLDEIFQLADVTWPIMVEEGLEHRTGKTRYLFTPQKIHPLDNEI